MKNLNVLITGANGYLGYETVRSLLASDSVQKVYAMVRNSQRYKGDIDFFPKDVILVDVDELFNGDFDLKAIDIICHLAAGRDSRSPETINSSLQFSSDLITLAVKNNVSGIIYTSSQAVYGTKPPLWSEDDTVCPVTLYAGTKFATELMLNSINTLSANTKTVSLRFSKVIGPSKNFRFQEAPHLMCKAALSGETIKLPANGKQLMDFIDVRDAAGVLRQFVEADLERWPEVMNVSSWNITLRELAKLISNISSKTYQKQLKVSMQPSGNYRDFGMSIKKLENIFNWKPKFTLEHTIKDVFNYIHKR